MTHARLDGEPYVEVVRGLTVESVHRVAACAVNRNGAVIYALGTIDVPVLLRSTAKPFIAAAAVREGVVERFGLTSREIAVMAASHSGEPFHIDAVQSILRKIGIGEEALQCGAHAPYDPTAAQALVLEGLPYTAIHNNCSGKHAGILALCDVLGSDPATYLSPESRVQRSILDFCARMCGQRVDDLPLAIDGCGIPVFATPLRNAALAFARLASLEGIDDRDAQALHVVRTAMMEHPEYVGGTGEYDTALMSHGNHEIAAKSGAEAVHGAASIARGVGVVLKVIDGGSRAVPPASLTLLRTLDLIEREELEALADFLHPIVRNRAGTVVGAIEAIP
jgi:L-asparaginase II